MLRILHTLPDMALGGGQILLLRLLKATQAQDVEHHVVSVWSDHGATLTQEFRDAGIQVYHLNLRRSRLPLAVGRLFSYARSHAIDVIAANNTFWDRRMAALAARLLRIPAVNTFHSMAFAPQGALIDWMDRRLLHGVFRKGVAVSDAVAEAWEPFLEAIALPRSRLQVIRPGLDLSVYQPRSPEDRNRLRTELGLTGDARVLLHVARLDQGKGHGYLAQVLAELRDRWPTLHLLLAGDGPLRAQLEETFRAAGVADRVSFLGQRNDVPALLNLADGVVFPSEGEGFGLAVAEAMAAGKPVVAFDLPVLREFLTPGATGLLTPLKDPSAMAAAVDELLRDEAKAHSLGQAARAFIAEHFSVERTARQVMEIYRELARSRSHSV